MTHGEFFRSCVMGAFQTMALPRLGPGARRTLTLWTEPVPVPPHDPVVTSELGITNETSRGPDSARVTVALFVDVGCHDFCSRTLQALDEVLPAFGDDVRFVVKHVPRREGAILPAEAAMAADDQGKRLPMEEQILTHEDHFERADLVGYARASGIDIDRFERDLDFHTFEAAVLRDRDDARSLGIWAALPVILINEKRIIGARGAATLRTAIEEALGRTTSTENAR
jgi:predicted DsbA family dithiol-disulfide isomerase